MPWYFLAAYADGVCAYGVRVRPAALCSFTADSDGITLRLDLRNGTQGVRLAGRTVKGGHGRLRVPTRGISEFEGGLPLLLGDVRRSDPARKAGCTAATTGITPTGSPREAKFWATAATSPRSARGTKTRRI